MYNIEELTLIVKTIAYTLLTFSLTTLAITIIFELLEFGSLRIT